MREDKYRTGLKRFWASLIDWFIFWGPINLYIKFRIVNNLQITQNASGDSIIEGDPNAYTTEIQIVYTTWTVLAVIYPIICHYKFGYTIGKWVTRVEVMDVSETKKLSLLQALLRDIIPVAVLVIYLVGMLVAAETDGLYNQFSQYVSIVPLIWWLLEIISMLTNPKRRGVQDFLARSVVLSMPKIKNRLSKVVYHS